MIVRDGCLALWVAASLLACRPPEDRPGEDAGPPRPDGERGRIVFLGTSLTAGLGLDPDQAYPALVQQKLDSAGLPYVAVNAGVSGETSAGARRRVDWLFREPVAVLVIETGANDGLRGQNVDTLRANIQAIIDRAKQQTPGPCIALVQMRTPPNYGFGYARRFREVYPELAEKNDVVLMPFLLEGVAGRGSLNQTDMIHPNVAGQRKVAETVWKPLERVLKGECGAE